MAALHVPATPLAPGESVRLGIKAADVPASASITSAEVRPPATGESGGPVRETGLDVLSAEDIAADPAFADLAGFGGRAVAVWLDASDADAGAYRTSLLDLETDQGERLVVAVPVSVTGTPPA